MSDSTPHWMTSRPHPGVTPVAPTPKPPDPEAHTPTLNFKFDPEKIKIEGKERVMTMQQSGLYLFDKSEKFDPKPPTHEWVKVEVPRPSGDVLTPLPKSQTVKIRGRTIKGILSLTQPPKYR